MHKQKPIRRVMALVLAAAMVLGTAPVTAMAAGDPAEMGISGEIISFEPLPEETSRRSVPPGTSLDDLRLPESLTVTVRVSSVADAEEPAPDAGEAEQPGETEQPGEAEESAEQVAPSDAAVSGDGQENAETNSGADAIIQTTTASPVTPAESNAHEPRGEAATETESMEMTIPLPVTWIAQPDYDGATRGTYRFSPQLPDDVTLASGVEVPAINITVGAAASTGIVTALDDLDDEIRWQNTTAPEFPETISGTVGDETSPIPVRWETEQAFNAEYPVRGLYVFAAVLGEGYGLADGVELPRITVYIPETVRRVSGLLRMSGSGASGSALQITTAAQLAEIAALVNAGRLETFLFNNANATVYLELQNDIDLSGYAGADNGAGWTPVGNNSNPFQGSFDGGGNEITGLTINRSDNYQGLFGCIGYIGSGGGTVTVQNLGIVSASITGGYFVGGVAGYIGSSLVQNCYVTGSIAGQNGVGSVAGVVSGTVQSCYSTGSVSGTGADVSGTGNYVGGVAGDVAPGGTVQNCYAAVSVNGNARVGGVAGYVASGGTVENCYATGSVSGTGVYVGGVAGYVSGTAGYVSGTVRNCAALNPILSGTSDVGRVAGYSSGDTLGNNYAFSGMSGGGSAKNHNGLDGADLTSSKLFGENFWTLPDNWDTPWSDTVWNFTDGKLPELKNVGGAQPSEGGLYLTARNIQYAAVALSSDSFTYNGSEQLPTLTVTFDGETLVRDTDYTVAAAGGSASNGTNAGTVTLTLTGKGNFTGTKTGVSYTIGKADNTLAISCANITYGQTPAPQADTNTGGGTVSYAYKVQGAEDSAYTSAAPAAAGSYTVRGTSAGTANYNAATATANFTIGKATPSLTLSGSPTDTQARPGSVELTAMLPGDATGTLTFKAGTDTIATVTLPANTAAFTPAGAANAYSFTAEYSGDSNYESKTSDTLAYSFTKSEQANVNASNGSVSYGQTLDLSTLVSGGSGTGSFSFTKTGGPGEITGTTLTPTGAGEVNITVTKAADNDYNAKSAAFKVTVNPRVITFTVAAVGTQAHTGSPVTPTPEVRDGTTVLTAGAHFTYDYHNNTDAGTSATINITGIGSYAGSAGAATFTIGGIVPGITTSPSVSGTVYTGTALSQITLTGGAASVSGHFEWVNPSATAAYGSNTFEVRFVPEDNLLYAQVSGIDIIFNAVNRSSGASSGDNDNSDSRGTTIVPAVKPNQPTAASVNAAAQVKNGTATLTITDSMAKAAIEKALADARTKGNTANGISVDISVTATGAAGFALALEGAALNRLQEAGVTSFSVSSLPVNMSFDTAALKQIQAQSGGNLAITVKPAAVTGLRSAFDITLSSTKDGKAVNITSLGTGLSTLGILAEPGKNEFGGYLYGAYVGTNNQITPIADSAYDANSRRVIFSASHFSVYGVGYTAPSARLTDISSHWAKDSIDYVVGRGLFGGGTDGNFQPDTAITRGDFVTALGRLSGANVSGYTTSSFTDVKADAYYPPYIEWAYKQGIIQGIGGNQFAPARAITREEIAVIVTNFARATGYTLPATRNAGTFTDAFSIGSAYKTAVTAMQQAGIMMGGSGNKFNPKASATRAEVSSMLHRYIKLTIDPATAQDWALKDDGRYLYYKNGAAVTGWQTIDGVKYYFYSTGGLQTGWVQDDGSWYFYSGNTRLTGWRNIGAGDSGKSYYFTGDGSMVSGKWLEIDGKWYYFYADGSLAVSTRVDEYEVDENGVRKDK